MKKNKSRVRYVQFTYPMHLRLGLFFYVGVGRVVFDAERETDNFNAIRKVRLEVMSDNEHIPHRKYWESIEGKNYFPFANVPDAVKVLLGVKFISLSEYLRFKAELLAKKHGKPDTKRRRQFIAYNNNTPVVRGVYYRDGNIQVLWRSDIGWTGEQYQNIAYVFGLMGNVTRVELVD